MSNMVQQISSRLMNYRNNLFKRLGMYQGSFILMITVFILMIGTAILAISTLIDFFSVLIGIKVPLLEYTRKDSIAIYVPIKRTIEEYYFGLFFLAGVSIFLFFVILYSLRWYVRMNGNRPDFAINYQDVKLISDIFNCKIDNPNLKTKSKFTKEIKAIDRLDKEFEEYLYEYE